MRQIYLVYEYQQYFDSERHLQSPAFTSIEKAKEHVHECGQSLWAYIQKNANWKYRVSDAPFIDRWVERDGEQIYEIGQTDVVSLTGKWSGGWGRWAIVPFKLEEGISEVEKA